MRCFPWWNRSIVLFTTAVGDISYFPWQDQWRNLLPVVTEDISYFLACGKFSPNRMLALKANCTWYRERLFFHWYLVLLWTVQFPAWYLSFRWKKGVVQYTLGMTALLQNTNIHIHVVVCRYNTQYIKKFGYQKHIPQKK